MNEASTRETLKLYNSLTKNKETFVSEDNAIKWYVCGPTVYDSPHIGHARTYISFDVVRRVLEEYFGYDVFYAMNVTNIDDKIINRSNEMLKSSSIRDNDAKEKSSSSSSCDLIAKIYEDEFFKDMRRLNVREPTVITKVTNYVAKIADFIDALVRKRYAYESNGSVYFDVAKYKTEYDYPLFVNDSAVRDDEDMNAGEKRNAVDFALWKAKSQEPRYDSKWGKGRPGWHIECSVMASDVFGSKIDIHSGGVDLCFPHHDNEVAQSQAFHGIAANHRWVNYFVHTGHLHVDGMKMSKSVKNFVTIADFLKQYTSRQMRIMFLNNDWWQPMTYRPEAMEFAISVEKKLFNYISIADVRIRERRDDDFTTVTEHDRFALNRLEAVKKTVYNALCDNIDTRATMSTLLDFISVMNREMDTVSVRIVKITKEYVEKILKLFGLMDEEEKEEATTAALEENVLNLFCKYREGVRKLCKEKKDYAEFYALSDKSRQDLQMYGYVIEDEGNECAIRKRR